MNIVKCINEIFVFLYLLNITHAFILQIPNIALLVCLACSGSQGHLSKIPSSVMPHSDLTIHAQRRLLSKMGDLHASNTATPFFLQPPTMAVASDGIDQHYQWWDNNNTPELVQSGWYGFNRFTSRAAKKLGNTSNRKARASFLLGESTQMQPLMSYKPPSQNQKPYDEDSAIHEVLRELQRHIRPLPQRGQPRIIMIDESFGLPRGVLVPVNRPPRHVNTSPRQPNYHSPRRDYRRLASAPMPVTIKVVPLKISSIDIANALKSMSFVPIPLDFIKTNDKSDEANAQIAFDDKASSDDEADLPPPSSHVATPLDNPLGITYAEAQRTDHFISNYQPRK